MEVLVLICCFLGIAAAQFFNQPFVFQQQQFSAAQQPVYSGQQHVPVLGPLGVPIEPKEVQQAKAAHLEILARQSARAQLEGNQQQQFNSRQQFTTSGVQVQPTLSVSQNTASFQVARPITQAQIRLGPNGVVQDTPEVALAKAEHFSLYAKQAEAAAKAKDTSVENKRNNKASVSVSVPLSLPIFSFNGIVGNGRPLFRKRRDLGSYGEHQHAIHIPIMTKNGVPLDTPEVQLARAQHMIAHYQAANQHHEIPHEEIVHPVIYNVPQDHYHHVPVIGPKGVPIEPPEVQAARAQHLAAHAEIRARHQHHHHEYQPEDNYYRYNEGQQQQQQYDDGQYRPEQYEYQNYHPQQYGGEQEYY